ncbi:MAG: LLM class F420-dependent oxidoreductase [Chloroflexi bacterium]|nr:LLM class F420-dependent oxidoreductase [Chloroflexota bacterium]
MSVHFGITIPHFGRNAQPGMVETVARQAEELGFDSVWASDHVIVPVGEGYIPDYFYDPLVVMTAAAAVTERVEIGVSVLVIPYRDPILTGKMLATLDQMSRGRIILGTGVGWLEQEFDALNADFHQRGAVCDEYLDVMQALWTTDPTTFEGHWTNFSEMRANPKPVREPFPIWVGGNGPPAIKRAAQRGTGWHPINLSLAEFTAGVESYHAACRDGGRPTGAICLRAMPGGRNVPQGDRTPFTGAPADVAQDVDTFAAAGMTHILFSPPVADLEQLEEEMQTIAKEVRPLVGAAP